MTSSPTPARSNRPRLFFSVLVPAWECAEYIVECLDSLAAQTFSSFEVVTLDDASSDGTHRIMGDYAARDSRFRHLGRNAERQTALPNLMHMIREARGDYIVIVDGDDYLPHAHVLDYIFCVYEDAPAVVATSGSYTRYPDGGIGHCRELRPGEEWFMSWPFGHPLTWRRDISLASFDAEPEAYLDPSTGQPYRSTYDLALFYPVADYCERTSKRIAHIAAPLYVYRRHERCDDEMDLPLQSLCARKLQIYWLNKVHQRERQAYQ